MGNLGVQCFGLVTTAVAHRRPERLLDLMSYMAIIARASQMYRWPSCRMGILGEMFYQSNQEHGELVHLMGTA